jgi:hypothetical protein
MPYPSTPCRRVTLETALLQFQGWPARRAAGLWLSYYPFGHPTPYAFVKDFNDITCQVSISSRKKGMIKKSTEIKLRPNLLDNRFLRILYILPRSGKKREKEQQKQIFLGSCFEICRFLVPLLIFVLALYSKVRSCFA